MKLRTIYRSSTWVLALLTALNLCLVVYVFFSLHHPLSYNIKVVEPPAPVLPQLELKESSLKSVPDKPESPVVVAPVAVVHEPYRWQHPYHYFVNNGRRGAYLNGTYVFEGDRHAYGIIRDIFPERIYFEGGNYIDNTVQQKGLLNDTVGTANTTLP